jgi:AcrR family transcriptional regulator
MIARITPSEAAARRETVLLAARWCFLNFGFAKTSLDDIARRAHISRSLIYKTFRDKEDIFSAVFDHWLTSRHPAAMAAADGPGSAFDRLMEICRLMVIEPWSDMAGAPMASEFFDVCERVDSKVSADHRDVARRCVASVLGDEESAEVLVLALDGLLGDDPATEVLTQRVRVLVGRFAPPQGKET